MHAATAGTVPAQGRAERSFSTPPAASETSIGGRQCRRAGRWSLGNAHHEPDPSPGTRVLLRMRHDLNGRNRREVGAAEGARAMGLSDRQSSKFSVQGWRGWQGSGRTARRRTALLRLAKRSGSPSLPYGGGCRGSAYSQKGRRHCRLSAQKQGTSGFTQQDILEAEL